MEVQRADEVERAGVRRFYEMLIFMPESLVVVLIKQHCSHRNLASVGTSGVPPHHPRSGGVLLAQHLDRGLGERHICR